MQVLPANELNVYDIMRRKYLVITTGGLRQLHARFYRHKVEEV